ncbi:nucleotide-binding protein [Phenylobacterium montanum]|uniref:AAA family ATPase n=1 Tax=Phenylobacterium montanum TaxID=2823693 RepID=A0A975FVU8_9CAUL|nr:AAA family ATPase [Caulobacter sp. S6]QUD86224.1 AAA family ATPase [Caulobacter sp. S6]
MRTIAVIGLKGGSGKTTIATHMALGGHIRGLTTLLADVDPQGSAREVLRARGGEGPEVVDATGSHLLSAQMTAVNAGVQLMVIDTAAGAVEEVGQAIVLADLSLLVVRPTLLDLAAMVRTVEVVRRLKKAALVVVNQAAPARDGVEPPMVKRALRALEFMRLPVAPVIIRSRAVYQTALETGRSAEEAWDDTAAEEMGELWTFIERFALGPREIPAAMAAER